jgi:hypothetical protein
LMEWLDDGSDERLLMLVAPLRSQWAHPWVWAVPVYGDQEVQ